MAREWTREGKKGVASMDDSVVFLTGAAEGLGGEIARELAGAGKRLALFDVQGDKLQAVADELSSATEVLPLVVDLADAAATEQAVQRALEHYGTPRALIHDAAVLKEVAMIDVTFENSRREVDVILQAAFILSRVLSGIDASFATGQRFNAFQMSEAMRSAAASAR
jgi:NAD(P)-dependent dehydrogenase (short-subunit alcohol dehydrogenase family)